MSVTINIDVLSIILLIFMLNEVITHLQNWWYREVFHTDHGGVVTLFMVTYVTKAILILGLISTIIK